MAASDALLAQLSEFIAERFGLHFPPDRWEQLRQCVNAAARELGFDDPTACIGRFLSVAVTKHQLQVLASHLVVGETYFFRDVAILEALVGHILPEIVRARRGNRQQLRIWSAGCCTGEEAYSLAMLLHESWPELRDWDVKIIGTDVSVPFLERASAGLYREWSFRSSPPRLKERYFTRTEDGRCSVLPQIRQLVSFAELNLAEDIYQSAALELEAMDMIFCRNVLMYFTPEQARAVIGRLHASLRDGGWLAVSPSEASSALFPQFSCVNLCGALLFRRTDAPRRAERTQLASPDFHRIGVARTRARAAATVDGQKAKPRTRVTERRAGAADERAVIASRARSLANMGKLPEAQTWCDRWIAIDKLNPAARYLRAVVLLETGRADDARTALQHTLYLDPGFVLAHLTLGNLARRRGNPEEMNRHFGNALHLLHGCDPRAALAESDGLTAGDVIQIIHSITSQNS